MFWVQGAWLGGGGSIGLYTSLESSCAAAELLSMVDIRNDAIYPEGPDTKTMSIMAVGIWILDNQESRTSGFNCHILEGI